MSALEDMPRRRPDVLTQEAHGQIVLLRPEDGGYYAVEDVGARIWELCDGQRSVNDIVVVICEEFDAPSDSVRSDVVAFVAELHSEQLLVTPA